MMKRITSYVKQYLEQRKRLGTGLSASAVQALETFAAFADECGAQTVTTDLFLSWKQRYGSASAYSWRCRLSHIRTFARWLQCIDPDTEVPSKRLIPVNHKRPQPYIYTDQQIMQIVNEAAQLESQSGLRGACYSTLFGLIAVTGLRISEALRLDDCDVNTETGVLHISSGKHDDKRLIAVTACTAERLADYRKLRDRVLDNCDNTAFFVGDTRRRITHVSADYNFALIGKRIGLRAPVAGKRGNGPRIHDLRHTFATATLIEWYRSGLDPDREMYKLSTWLGHKNLEGTYWYLEAVPELLQLAVERGKRSLSQENRS